MAYLFFYAAFLMHSFSHFARKSVLVGSDLLDGFVFVLANQSSLEIKSMEDAFKDRDVGERKEKCCCSFNKERKRDPNANPEFCRL